MYMNACKRHSHAVLYVLTRLTAVNMASYSCALFYLFIAACVYLLVLFSVACICLCVGLFELWLLLTSFSFFGLLYIYKIVVKFVYQGHG